MTRENFTLKVREQIAESAGYQCSFPTCDRRTIGPSQTPGNVSKSGYAAHIYAASPRGPRGQGGLSPSELQAAGNGIWLCGTHAKLVDNNRGMDYPPEVLLSYKALHESRVLLEHEGLYPPVGWLHKLEIIASPIFRAQQAIQLAKLNLICGNNGTGKTAIVEWIASFFDCQELRRWMLTGQKPLELRMSVLTPKLQSLSLRAKQGRITYHIEGQEVAFIPVGFTVLKPKRLDYSILDDREMLSRSLGLPAILIPSLLDEANRFPHAHISNLRFEMVESEEDNPTGTKREILRANVPGAYPGLGLRNLSGAEAEGVLLELAMAAARLSGKYCPTLLILDAAAAIICEGFFEYYSYHLLDPINQFQTLLTIPTRNLNLDNIRWNGWQVIRTVGSRPNITLNQDIRRA